MGMESHLRFLAILYILVGIIGGIAVSGSTLLFASEDQSVYAFDVVERTLAWRYRAKGRIRTAPVVGGGKAYFVAEESLYAIELN